MIKRLDEKKLMTHLAPSRPSLTVKIRTTLLRLPSGVGGCSSGEGCAGPACLFSAGVEVGLSSMTREEDIEGGTEGVAEGGSEKLWPYRRCNVTKGTLDILN